MGGLAGAFSDPRLHLANLKVVRYPVGHAKGFVTPQAHEFIFDLLFSSQRVRDPFQAHERSPARTKGS
jgi:hypothetical protein